MSKKFFSDSPRAFAVALILSVAALPAFSQAGGGQQDAKPAVAQDAAKDAPKRAVNDERAEAIIRHAIEALGGGAYLDVRSIVSRGNYTPFTEGVGGLPVTFLDYLVFPDRERTEFKGSSIQANMGDTGWVFDVKMKKIVDMQPEQVRSFRTLMRTSLDNVLRGWWRAEGAALSYVGRREAGLAKRNDVVRLTYPDGFVVEFEFGTKDYLPSKTRYKKENAEGEQVEEEERYAQFLPVGGVRVPFIIDHYRAGVQMSRVNYQEVEFNRAVPDSLFTKPADLKALK
jgi:hypothetical protein